MLQNSNAIEDGGYVIERSLRVPTGNSLLRTPSQQGNLRTWTLSFWIKRASFDGQIIFGALYQQVNVLQVQTQLGFGTNGEIYLQQYNSNLGYQANIISSAVLRDPSAWYHITYVWDTPNAIASDRVRIYLNNERITSFSTSTYPVQNLDGWINNISTTPKHGIGILFDNGPAQSGSGSINGYLAEFNFIDGQALTPSNFGEVNQTTGQWVAKKFKGTYGTNGFYLDFKDGTSTTTLGQDKSGNNNHWTLNNFTRSAGVNDCWMKDVPSGNGSAGVQPSSNYATLNPLKRYSANLNFSKGNLTVSDNSASISTAISSFILPTTGKYYFEVTATTISAANGFVGVATESTANGNTAFQTEGRYRSNGDITNLAGTLQTGGTSYTSGDVVGVAVDVDNGTVQFYKNNVVQGATPSFTFTAGTKLVPYIATDNNAAVKTFEANFGQRSFAYTPPTGFKALCTANLPTPSIIKPSNHFNVSLWTGDNSSSRAITGLTFSPDFTWIRCRSKNYSNHLVDSVRGSTNSLNASTTGSQVVNSSSGYVSSLDSNGFTVNFGTSSGQNVNEVSQTYVAWNWRASESTPVTNTDGSITSTVSSNPTAGFSIVTYTGTGADATVGHGLGIAPSVIIVKNVSLGVSYWCVQHKSLTVPSVLRLNDVTASASATNIWSLNINTSLVFSVGAANETNRVNSSMVAYCFAEIAGYSKFGSYTGNGSADGPFVYLGFRPAFVMIKRTDTTSNWTIFDNRRSGYNIDNDQLYANTNTSEVTTDLLDLNSNGFKLRSTDASVNASGGTYIYMAFAETSMTYSNAR